MDQRFRNGLLTTLACLLSLTTSVSSLQAENQPAPESGERFLIVVGASGLEEYESQFARWAARWKEFATKKGAQLTLIGETVDARHTDLELLKRELARQTESVTATWVILIGHGTFDGKTARFNLRGPDLTAEDLNESCETIQHPLAMINCFSSSGAFLNVLSAENRVVITATKNGFEFYFSRFGEFLSEAGSQPSADLDHDGQVSLLEAYLSACRETEAYYQQKGELATEHALLDDNADQHGSRGNEFHGLKRTPDATTKTGFLPDGHRAHQFSLFETRPVVRVSGEQKQVRDQLELQILALKQRKAEFTNQDEYYQQLEPLMIQLAHVYRRLDQQIIYDPLVVPVNAKKTD